MYDPTKNAYVDLPKGAKATPAQWQSMNLEDRRRYDRAQDEAVRAKRIEAQEVRDEAASRQSTAARLEYFHQRERRKEKAEAEQERIRGEIARQDAERRTHPMDRGKVRAA